MAAEHATTDTSLATAALVIALCSLFVTTGQLLGQYFATADGYRRCQQSVMGSWAKLTRLRWRWSQFRFEILFSVPEIFLAPLSSNQTQQRVTGRHNQFEPITGSYDSRYRTMVDSYPDSEPNDERVCWLTFLDSLHQCELELQQQGHYNAVVEQSLEKDQLVGPAMKILRRSWDFMSPDIIRPLARTNVSDIAVMVRRLGMTWKDFRPEDGVMRAEGNGHLVTSTMTRSIGVILHYMKSMPQQTLRSDKMESLANKELYISTTDSDRMGFGILPGYARLQIPDFRIGNLDDVLETMNIIDNSGGARQTITNVRFFEPRVTFGFSDIIPLAAPMLRLRGSTVIRVPIPTEYCVGLTCHKEGFVVFYHRLREYISDRDSQVSEQTKWVLEQYEDLKRHYVAWEDEVEANRQGNSRSLEFLEKVHSCWDSATAYFVELQESFTKERPTLRYYDLMASHITHAVNYWGDAWSHLRGDDGKKARDHYGLRDWIAEGAHMYFDYLPRIVSDMRGKGFDYEELVHEAWFTMMFRAFYWWRCHYLVDGQDMPRDPCILPSRYWGSKLPVSMG